MTPHPPLPFKLGKAKPAAALAPAPKDPYQEEVDAAPGEWWEPMPETTIYTAGQESFERGQRMVNNPRADGRWPPLTGAVEYCSWYLGTLLCRHEGPVIPWPCVSCLACATAIIQQAVKGYGDGKH